MAQGLILQHSKRVKTIQNGQKIKRRFAPTERARTRAQCLRIWSAYARLWGEKPTRLPNDAFMKLVSLPTTNGSAPKSI
jgi:hypothetical protein